MDIRLLLVDDHQLVREVMRQQLSTQPGIDVIGEAGTGEEALSALGRDLPDVLILDIGLPGADGIEVARQVTRLYPTVRILALSCYTDRDHIQAMLNAGALGYLPKSAQARDLMPAIRAVAAGHRFVAPEAAPAEGLSVPVPAPAAPPPSVLGKREREVLCLVAGGGHSAQIAARLGIAVGTAEAHRRNIKRKLGLKSTAELTRYAIREGLIPA